MAKSKLVVFAKKEVHLIMAFFLVTVFISFTFGFRLGKSYSFSQSSFSQEDRESLNEVMEMKTPEEEKIALVDSQRLNAPRGAYRKEALKDTNELLSRRLSERLIQEGLEEEKSPKAPQAPRPSKVFGFQGMKEETKREMRQEREQEVVEKKRPTLTSRPMGKYTIQVGSFRSLAEAEDFAKGFQVRGYDPIIEKADLGLKGVWFRVSLGSFPNIPMAREYIKKENSLFAGQDYEIRPIK